VKVLRLVFSATLKRAAGQAGPVHWLESGPLQVKHALLQGLQSLVSVPFFTGYVPSAHEIAVRSAVDGSTQLFVLSTNYPGIEHSWQEDPSIHFAHPSTQRSQVVGLALKLPLGHFLHSVTSVGVPATSIWKMVVLTKAGVQVNATGI